MPTALDVNVDAITPPHVMKKKKNEGNKITPATTTAEKPKAKKAQPSIMNFFQQPSSNKKLFKNNSTIKKNPKKKSPPTVTKSSASSKPKASAQKPPPKFSSVPTQEELREIVLGTSSANVDNVQVPDAMDMPPPRGDDEDSLLPAVTMRNPGLKRRSKQKSSPPPESPAKDGIEDLDDTFQENAPDKEEVPAMESTNAAAQDEELHGESTNAPVEGALEVKSGAESIITHEEEQEKEAQDISEDGSVDEEETRDSKHDNDDDDQSDDDTVEMSPSKQTLKVMATESQVAEEAAADGEESVDDTSAEGKAANEDVESREANKESIECLDLTVDDADAPAATSGAEKPKPDNSKKLTAKPSPSKPESAVGISAERQAALAKNAILRAQYQSRLDGLIQRAHEGLDEENFQLLSPSRVETLPEEGTTVSSPLEFPECAIRSLALLVQERYVLPTTR